MYYYDLYEKLDGLLEEEVKDFAKTNAGNAMALEIRALKSDALYVQADLTRANKRIRELEQELADAHKLLNKNWDILRGT